MKKGVTFFKCNTILTFMCDICSCIFIFYLPSNKKRRRPTAAKCRISLKFNENFKQYINGFIWAPLSLHNISMDPHILSSTWIYIYIPPIPSSTWIYLWIHPYTLPLPESIYGSSYTLLFLNIYLDPPILSSTWIHL